MKRAAWILLLCLALPALASACPSCKNALADDPAAHGFARGIYLSIILMLGVTFTLVGLIIWKVVRLAQADPGNGAAPRP